MKTLLKLAAGFWEGRYPVWKSAKQRSKGRPGLDESKQQTRSSLHESQKQFRGSSLKEKPSSSWPASAAERPDASDPFAFSGH